MNGAFRGERGVGIIEVVIALAVLMFAVLAISSLQTSSLASMRISESHFTINERTKDMLELLRANAVDARSGTYNLDYEETLTDTDPVTSPIAYTISQWKQRVSEELREGAGKIECNADKCTVSLRWEEYIDDSTALQYFNMAGPI